MTLQQALDEIARLKRVIASLGERDFAMSAALLEACNIAMGDGYFVDKFGLVGLALPQRKRIDELRRLGEP